MQVFELVRGFEAVQGKRQGDEGMSEQRELILFLDSVTLKKKLGLPEDSVIITVYEQSVNYGERQFCFRYSTKKGTKP